MEKENTNKPLATESFSYSWLTHQNPCSSNCKTPPKFFEQSFDFDVPGLTSSSRSNFVHADEIFSEGRIMPVYNERRRIETQVSIYPPRSPIVSGNMRTRCYLLGKWRKTSRKILQKCIGFFSSRIHSRVDDLDRKVSEVSVKSGKSSSNVSPSRSSNACFETHDADNSIHEAILYCKRSIGKCEEDDRRG